MSLKKFFYWISPFVIVADVLLLSFVFNDWWRGFLTGSYIFFIFRFLPISIISLLLILFCFYKIIREESETKKVIYFFIFNAIIFIISILITYLMNLIDSCEGTPCMGLVVFPFYLSGIISTFILITFIISIVPQISNYLKEHKKFLLIYFLSAFIFSYILGFFSTLFIGNYELDSIIYFITPMQLMIFPIFIISCLIANKIFKRDSVLFLLTSIVILFLTIGGLYFSNTDPLRTTYITIPIVVGVSIFISSLFYFGFAFRRNNLYILVLVLLSILMILAGFFSDYYFFIISYEDNIFNENLECEKIVRDSTRDWCYTRLASGAQDISKCDKIVREVRKYQCYASLAKFFNDLSICDRITRLNSREVCYMEFSSFYQIADLCEKINTPSYKQQCEWGICEEQKDILSKDHCYYSNAIDREKLELCEKVLDEEMKSKCKEVIVGNINLK
jgi:hypothetical protein